MFLAKLQGEGSPVWSGQAYIYSQNYLLNVGVIISRFVRLLPSALGCYKR